MNYYEQIFDNLSQTLGQNQALDDIAKIFLFRNTKFSMPENLNKTDVFFQSNFIQYLQQSHLQTDDWQWALSQYFRFGKIDNNLLEFFLNLDEEKTIFAIRLSGIINNSEHLSWQNIKHHQKNYSKLNEFIQTVEYLNKQYQEIRNKYLEIKKKWQWTHFDVIIFSSLYLWEVLITQYGKNEITIPYQIDPTTPIKNEYLFDAIHHLITNAYKSRKTLTDKIIGLYLKNKMSPFLYGEGLTELKLIEYDDFKKFIAFKIELDLFDDFVFNVFSFNKTTRYTLINGVLNHQSSEKDYDYYAEKFTILNFYWEWRGIKYINKDLENDINFLRLDRGKNFIGNMEAFLSTHSTMMLLKEIYGIDKITINTNEYNIFDTLFAMNMQQKFYQKAFVDVFLDISEKERLHPFQVLGLMAIQGAMEMENRFPFAFGWKKDKSKRMSDWISNIEISKKERVRQMSDILEFWTVNLNHKNEGSYIEKPLYQLDDLIIEFPQRIAQQNIYGGIVNYLRKLHKNRDTLKDETNSMEKSLAELFTQKQFKVFCQYMPNDNTVGEIDLIIVDNQTVLIIELKSTFLKTDLKEAYQYQNFTLKKASYQLDRKLKYIQDNYQEFTDKPFDKVKFYSWIVDTTLEADHERFNQHLKISLEELIIYLKGHQNFMNFYENFDDFDTKNDEINNLQVLIDKIEGNYFWENALQKYQKFGEKQ